MSAVDGTTLLLRQNVRRDRVIVPGWLAVLSLMAYASASAVGSLFSTAQERLMLATSINGQPGLLALYGPILDPGSTGELAMSKLTVLYALLSAILYVVLVRRHTRIDEESGRAELIGGTAVGRAAPMLAVVVECIAVALLLGLLVAAANAVGGLPVAGSLWFGISWAGTGLVATGIAAVACQLSASARTCGAIAAAMLAAAFAVRAAGDALDGWHWISWLSPLGWNTQLRAWSEPRWWVSVLYLALSAALLALAGAMRARRDLGAGLIEARPGRVSGWIAGAWGLTLRLQRTSLVLWTVGIAGLGLLFGAMTPGFDDLFRGTGAQEIIDRLGGAFLAALLPIIAIVVTCYPVAVASGAHQDEAEGRTGTAIAAGTSRARWFAATATFAAVGAAWLMLVAGLCLRVGYGAAGGAGGADVLPAAAGWIPAVWFVGALALAGFAARQGWVGWTLLVTFLTLTLVGELLELPGWMVRLSPYSAVPLYPAEAWSWRPDLVLLALTASIVVGAWLLFQRRDLE
ncbi:hypothetical protein [Nocardioides sp. YIM 152588]|uniref:ABC transporter permease n=1 Tax=Nocardioides sp. YIM 152588 TaxID=3158259 RepID=UPI0032E4DF9D